MIFLTSYKAGEQWLRERIEQSSSIVDHADGSQAPGVIQLIRNPISILVDAHAEILSGESAELLGLSEAVLARFQNLSLNESYRQVLAALSGRKNWLLQDCDEQTRRRFRFPSLQIGTLQNRLLIRVEDFVAFPIATIHRIENHIGTPLGAEIQRAFVGCSTLRQRKSSVRRHCFSGQSQMVLAPSIARPEKLDLFSWADHLPGLIAHEVCHSQLRMLAQNYPEIVNVFSDLLAPLRTAA